MGLRFLVCELVNDWSEQFLDRRFAFRAQEPELFMDFSGNADGQSRLASALRGGFHRVSVSGREIAVKYKISHANTRGGSRSSILGHPDAVFCQCVTKKG